MDLQLLYYFNYLNYFILSSNNCNNCNNYTKNIENYFILYNPTYIILIILEDYSYYLNYEHFN